jgi:hypothetical protein
VSRPNYLVLSAVLGLSGSALAAQTPVQMSKPDASFPEPFSRLSGVRELPSGKVLIADRQDKVVQVLDLASGSATKVGREGQGPGEYALPMGLFAMPNGETWVNDLLGRRFLVVDAQGKPGKFVQLPSTGAGGGMVMMGTGGGTDATGRYYHQAPPINIADPSGPSPDSLAILRWDGVKPAMDTVAWVIGPRANVQSSGGNRIAFRVGGGKVFTPQESWGVAADGSVARVIPNPYRVVWYPAGGTKGVAGTVQAYSPLKVTEADKKEYTEQQRRNPQGMAIRIGGGGGTARNIAPGDLPPPEFEDTKPPFSGPGSVLVAPEGEVWVRRTQPAGTKNPVYDVFDRSGSLVKKVTLNPRSVVLGFGKGTVYVVRSDEDDLQYLERYRR